MQAALSEKTAREPDLDLVQRHRYGDPAAFEEIYSRFEVMVYNLALRLAGDPDVAADLTQETFLRVFRHLGSFRGRSSLKTWIYRVTLNCCRSGLGRRERRRRRIAAPPREGLERLPDPAAGPEDVALSRDAGRRVEAALERLPAVFREAVVLRDLQGLTYREIAAVLKVRVGTVRSRIARGRDRLRAIMEESG